MTVKAYEPKGPRLGSAEWVTRYVALIAMAAFEPRQGDHVLGGVEEHIVSSAAIAALVLADTPHQRARQHCVRHPIDGHHGIGVRSAKQLVSREEWCVCAGIGPGKWSLLPGCRRASTCDEEDEAEAHGVRCSGFGLAECRALAVAASAGPGCHRPVERHRARPQASRKPRRR